MRFAAEQLPRKLLAAAAAAATHLPDRPAVAVQLLQKLSASRVPRNFPKTNGLVAAGGGDFGAVQVEGNGVQRAAVEGLEMGSELRHAADLGENREEKDQFIPIIQFKTSLLHEFQTN